MDEFSLDLPAQETLEDLPAEIQDRFADPVAYQFAFVGVGQCGGRIVDAFHGIGYSRTAAINTTDQDLDDLKIPADHKLSLKTGGAGKDPAAAEQAIQGRDEDVRELLVRSWGPKVDYAFVCLGAGGGTGAGAFMQVARIVRDYMESNGRPPKVGLIIAMPNNGDGKQAARNAIGVFRQLVGNSFSPVIFVDNEKAGKIHSRTAAGVLFSTINTAVAKLLHSANKLSGNNSEHTTFDKADFAKLLDSGVLDISAGVIPEPHNEQTVPAQIRNFQRGAYTDFDIGKAKQAALVFVAGNDLLMTTLPRPVLDAGFSMFNRMFPAATTHQGLYGVSGSLLFAIAIVGGLSWPTARLTTLAKTAGIPEDQIGLLGG